MGVAYQIKISVENTFMEIVFLLSVVESPNMNFIKITESLITRIIGLALYFMELYFLYCMTCIILADCAGGIQINKLERDSKLVSTN